MEMVVIGFFATAVIGLMYASYKTYNVLNDIYDILLVAGQLTASETMLRELDSIAEEKLLAENIEQNKEITKLLTSSIEQNTQIINLLKQRL